MKPVLTASEMKQWDMNTINDIGIPSMVLMERASLAIAAKCAEKCQDDKEHKRILAVCGSGNNGGDGACAARILHMWGY
ncbi:MAG: bifunctional ADP-dependent NAD(P)H-hydrate dehydratase/NAD(P)H-hydrate epimerase, partial [Lachnospiraceae bacterium]|nr:bifunctional ADP-dependent NAD(P)H-hydrate dehydratase/NAD(P)H-hydrate epimerase [Candidatus Equihabitans merdae]